MALTKPILNSVVSWDVSLGQTFTFNVIGGDQVVGNTLYIINNATNTVVYTLNTTSYQYRAIVPPNASGLTNGTYYSAYIVTKNSSNQTSVASNTIQFYCYTTPTWNFSNISSGTTVNNSSVNPTLYYNQIQGEALADYTINLYDSGRNLLSTSGVKYTGSSASTQNVSFAFYGLEDNTAYFVEGIGHTTGGTLLNTGLIGFTVSYIAPESFNVLVVQNNCDEGYVTYYSLAYVNEGSSNPSPPNYYTYQGETGVDLRAEGSWVKWDSSNSNFIIPQNFTLKAWVLNPNVNTNLITLSNGVDNINIWYGYYLSDYSKVIVSLTVNTNQYFAYSNLIDTPATNQELCIQIRKINNLYEVILGVV